MEDGIDEGMLANAFKKLDKMNPESRELRQRAHQAGQEAGVFTDYQKSCLSEFDRILEDLNGPHIVTKADLELLPDQPLLLVSPRDDA